MIQLHKDVKKIKIEKRVRQGSTISPKLFTSYLEEIFRELNWEYRGMDFSMEYLNHLRFVDDIILITETAEELQDMVTDLNRKSHYNGFEDE